MSVRKIWVVDLEIEKVIFSKSFQTVERRAKLLHSHNYIQIPPDGEFLELLLKSVGLSDNSGEFNPLRDGCDKLDEKPIFQVNNLWPVIVMESINYLLCCLPLVESADRPQLINIPSVAVGFSTLTSIGQYITLPKFQVLTVRTEKFLALQQYLVSAMPFGTPIMLNSENIEAMHDMSTSQSSHSTKEQQKTPAWKPMSGLSSKSSKPSLMFKVVETVRCYLYDHGNEVKDVCEVYGSVYCKGDLEGTMPIVNVSVCSNIPLDHLYTHPCVLQADSDNISEEVQQLTASHNTNVDQFKRKIKFSPPLGPFTLCHYISNITASKPPLSAFYQMKLDNNGSNSQAKLLVQIKLAGDGFVKNSFDYLDVCIPFINHGKIINKDLTLSQGASSISTDSNSINWSVGHSLNRKTYEATLNGTVILSGNQATIYKPVASSLADNFCHGQNGYIKLNFKVNDFTLSRCRIDEKYISVLPHCKLKLNVSKELVAHDYKVWNSHGNPFLALSNMTE